MQAADRPDFEHETSPAGVIALLGMPCDLGGGHPGPVMSPMALRIAGLPERLAELGFEVIDHGDLVRPAPVAFEIRANTERGAGRCNHLGKLTAWVRHIYDKSYEVLKTGATPVFLGGDHTIAFGTISAVARHCAETGKDLVVLWIDAHGDFNTPMTSDTGNMHGMPLAFLTGEPSLAGILGDRPFTPIAAARLCLFGLRSIDRVERKALRDSGIACVDMGQIDETGVSSLIRQFIARVAGPNVHLHVSFDTDALDPDVAPGVATPVPGGISYREAHLIMELLHESGLVGSVDLVELNPYLDERGRSATVVAELAASLFGRTVLDAPAERRPLYR
jgi:arginase